MTAACQASLSITNSWSSLKLMSIESVVPSSHLILCRPLFLLPPIPPSIRVFSNKSTLRMRWPKYWSFSFSISPSNGHPGLISFRMDWMDLLAVQGTLKSLQHHSSKASILLCSAFFRAIQKIVYLSPIPSQFLKLSLYPLRYMVHHQPLLSFTTQEDLSNFSIIINTNPQLQLPLGFSGGSIVRRIHLQWRHRFDPWVGKNLWRRKWQPTPVFLPGKYHGRGDWWAVYGCQKNRA